MGVKAYRKAKRREAIRMLNVLAVPFGLDPLHNEDFLAVRDRHAELSKVVAPEDVRTLADARAMWQKYGGCTIPDATPAADDPHAGSDPNSPMIA